MAYYWVEYLGHNAAHIVCQNVYKQETKNLLTNVDCGHLWKIKLQVIFLFFFLLCYFLSICNYFYVYQNTHTLCIFISVKAMSNMPGRPGTIPRWLSRRCVCLSPRWWWASCTVTAASVEKRFLQGWLLCFSASQCSQPALPEQNCWFASFTIIFRNVCCSWLIHLFIRSLMPCLILSVQGRMLLLGSTFHPSST